MSDPKEQPEGSPAEGEFVACLSAKEIKKLAKPEFAANPDKFYPTPTLKKLGFSRASCPSCGNNFWRHTDKRITCGDSQCEKKYTFIGVGTGKGRNKPDGTPGTKISYAQAWEGFRNSLSTARIPCTPIPRYPVVARWRADVDYVAAGIFCFQPYCVTGELAPPANPLICPQFCLRFNDLDNIGLTGRHYSGFIMLGIQVFNKPNEYKFWMNECVEFNYRWLTEELEIDPDEITFIEDVWAGGGNLGPSIEYFVSGLELGNMVFMQYKTFPDGSREPLQVQVIDVGIGLERVPWLINGSPTSYVDVFPSALEFLQSRINLDVHDDVWKKFGPLSCLLNVDEVDDLQATWNYIGEQIGMEGDKVKDAVEPVKELYTILDHTRSVLMAVEDGSLPSNVGGAANVRNILRRSFALLQNKGWWEKLGGMAGFLELFNKHKQDLSTIYGPFKEYKSFKSIIELEYKRWQTTDSAQAEKLQKLIKKKGPKDSKLTLDEWIVCVSSWGVAADQVAKITGQPIPLNLYYEIASRQEKMVRATAAQLYATAHLPETNSLYYGNHLQYEFTGKILEVMRNVTDGSKPNIVVLDQSSFYPTSGGQEHDTGKMTIDGVVYDVVDVMKVGPCVLHVLNPPLPEAASLDSYKGKEASGVVDEVRRSQLRNNHTAAHVVNAACVAVLGPHVWQAGAKKSVHQAHLDITHFESITFEQQQQIETTANEIVFTGTEVEKGHMPKDEAEAKFGMSLYQGGVVPGNSLRVVNIKGIDTEACCGTHADNTSEIGFIKILKVLRISDGIVRLYFVAGKRALEVVNKENALINSLTTSWGISADDVIPTAERFFKEARTYGSQAKQLTEQVLDLKVKLFVQDPATKLGGFESTEDNATLYIGNMPAFAQKLKDQKKGVVFVGASFIYGLLGSAELLPKLGELEAALQKIEVDSAEEDRKKKEKKAQPPKDGAASSSSSAAVAPAPAASSSPAPSKGKLSVRVKDTVSITSKDKKGKKVVEKVSGVAEFVVFAYEGHQAKVVEWFKQNGFTFSE